MYEGDPDLYLPKISNRSGDVQTYECKLCGKTFERKFCWSRHMKTHVDTDVLASGLSMVDRDSMAEDLEDDGGGTAGFNVVSVVDKKSGDVVKKFECLTCGKLYARKFCLMRHLEMSHADEPLIKVLICDACNASFRGRLEYKEHRKIHKAEKAYRCTVCNKCFLRRFELAIHERTHTGERPYLCNICNIGFAQNGGLSRHMQQYHTIEKPFKCEVCGKEFVSKPELTVHGRTHTGEKPYECKLCFKKFTQYNSLYVHIKIHTGSKSARCDICRKVFTTKSDLNKHVRTHTGEKPYQCHVCFQEFSLRYNLKRHISSHHKDRMSPTNSKTDPSLTEKTTSSSHCDLPKQIPFPTIDKSTLGDRTLNSDLPSPHTDITSSVNRLPHTDLLNPSIHIGGVTDIEMSSMQTHSLCTDRIRLDEGDIHIQRSSLHIKERQGRDNNFNTTPPQADPSLNPPLEDYFPEKEFLEHSKAC